MRLCLVISAEKGPQSVVLGQHQVPHWFPQLPLPLSGQRSAVNRLRLLGKTLGFQTSDYAKCKKSGCRGECCISFKRNVPKNVETFLWVSEVRFHFPRLTSVFNHSWKRRNWGVWVFWEMLDILFVVCLWLSFGALIPSYVFSTFMVWAIYDDPTNLRRALTSPTRAALVHTYSCHLT